MKRFFVSLFLVFISISGFAVFPACSRALEPCYEGIEENGEIVAYSFVGVKNCKSEFDITIPSAYNDKPVIAIKNNAFNGNKLLKSIFIPKTVSDIGPSVFSGCSALENITVAENNEHYKSIDGNLYNKAGNSIIRYAIGKSETSFTIPDGVEWIRGDCFTNANHLTDVVISDIVMEIGWFAFAGCYSLKSITIGKNMRGILIAAFFGCNSLENVYFKGSEEEWANISIGENNACLTAATIHYTL